MYNNRKKLFLVLTSGKSLETLGSRIGTGLVFLPFIFIFEQCGWVLNKICVVYCLFQSHKKGNWFTWVCQKIIFFHELHPLDDAFQLQLQLHLPPDFWKINCKNQVRRTGFLVYFKLNFYCLCSLQKSISKLVFAG